MNNVEILEQLQSNLEKQTEFLLQLSNDYIKLLRAKEELEFKLESLEKMFLNHHHRKKE